MVTQLAQDGALELPCLSSFQFFDTHHMSQPNM